MRSDHGGLREITKYSQNLEFFPQVRIVYKNGRALRPAAQETIYPTNIATIVK